MQTNVEQLTSSDKIPGKIVLIMGTSTAGKTTLCQAVEARARAGGTSVVIDGTDAALDGIWTQPSMMEGVAYKSANDHFINAMKQYADPDIIARAAAIFDPRTLIVAVLSRSNLGNPKVDTVNLEPEEDLDAQAKRIYASLSQENKAKYKTSDIKDVLSIIKSCPSPLQFKAEHPYPPLDKVNDHMLEQAITQAKKGTTTILDIVGNETIEDGLMVEYLQIKIQSAGLPADNGIVVVAHCPIDVLTDRIITRNKEAIERGKVEDIRQAFFPFQQYAMIYQRATNDVDQQEIIGQVSRDDIQKAAREFGNGEKDEKYLIRELGFKEHEDSIDIMVRSTSDLIFQTATMKPEECAEELCDRIFNNNYLESSIVSNKKLTALQKAMAQTSTEAEKNNMLSNFWQSIQKNPVCEQQNDNTCHLTFLYRGKPGIKQVNLCSAVCDPSLREQGKFIKMPGTDIWSLTIKNVPSDARITYQYFANGKPTSDPLNSFKISAQDASNGDLYIAEMPDAKYQPYVPRDRLPGIMQTLRSQERLLRKKIDFSQSKILAQKEPYMADTQLSSVVLQADMADELQDEALRGMTKQNFRRLSKQGASRDYWVHLPPNYDPNHRPPYKVLIHLDGEETITSMRLPAITENAMRTNHMEPTITVYIDVANRNIEYGCGPDAEPFADFLATEFLPELQKEYPSMSRASKDTTLAGFSMGGHAAAHIATRHPEVFGNIIGQSSAFWMGAEASTGEFEPTEGLLKKLQQQEYPNNPAAKKQCFYLNVGRLETAEYQLSPSGNQISGNGVAVDIANQHFAEFLTHQKIPCEFETYTGDHCFAEWQELLIEGLDNLHQLRMTNAVVPQYKRTIQEMKQQSEKGYLTPTESSNAKKTEKYTPLQTTPKPWK